MSGFVQVLAGPTDGLEDAGLTDGLEDKGEVVGDELGLGVHPAHVYGHAATILESWHANGTSATTAGQSFKVS